MDVDPSTSPSGPAANPPNRMEDVFALNAGLVPIRYDSEAEYKIDLPREKTPNEAYIAFACQVVACGEAGASFAIAAGRAVDTSKIVNSEAAAVAAMTTKERKMYEAFKSGIELDAYDFPGRAIAVSNTAVTRAKYTGYAADLDVMYKHEGTTPEEAKG